MTLSSPSSNAVLGTNPTATGTIENDDTASTDAALKSLAITAGGSSVVLTPTFAAGVYSYRAYVENTVASVSVAAEANHRKATVAIIEGTDLAFGENTLTLRVTAEDGGTTQDYTGDRDPRPSGAQVGRSDGTVVRRGCRRGRVDCDANAGE